MVFNHHPAPCFMVHIVNVLGDHCFQHVFLFHSGQEPVCSIGPCINKVIVKDLGNDFPRFLWVSVEMFYVENGRIIFGPDSFFTPERRNPAFNRNSGTRECHQMFCIYDPPCSLDNILLAANHFCPIPGSLARTFFPQSQPGKPPHLSRTLP